MLALRALAARNARRGHHPTCRTTRVAPERSWRDFALFV